MNTLNFRQFINGANWKGVENTVRNLGTHYGDLEVITGTHDILVYNKYNGGIRRNDYLMGKNNITHVIKIIKFVLI